MENNNSNNGKGFTRCRIIYNPKNWFFKYEVHERYLKWTDPSFGNCAYSGGYEMFTRIHSFRRMLKAKQLRTKVAAQFGFFLKG